MLRGDMAYGDCFKLTVKDFGTKVVIKVNRGKPEISKDGKTVTITYEDGKVRGPRP